MNGNVPPQIEKTESQKMRLTAIWTNRFKKIARLKKLQTHMKELDEVTTKLQPFKRRQFFLMIVAEVVALCCILIPSVFEINNNQSIRATAELRDFQLAGDRVGPVARPRNSCICWRRILYVFFSWRGTILYTLFSWRGKGIEKGWNKNKNQLRAPHGGALQGLCAAAVEPSQPSNPGGRQFGAAGLQRRMRTVRVRAVAWPGSAYGNMV